MGLLGGRPTLSPLRQFVPSLSYQNVRSVHYIGGDAVGTLPPSTVGGKSALFSFLFHVILDVLFHVEVLDTLTPPFGSFLVF